jgi:hypothetical protein
LLQHRPPLLAQTVGQPGHLVGGGPEPRTSSRSAEQPPEHPCRRRRRAAGHRGEHVQVVHQQPAFILGDGTEGVAGLQQEQRGREHALADGGQASAPDGVELADLAIGEALAGDGRHQARAGLRVGARQGDQYRGCGLAAPRCMLPDHRR